MAYRDSGSFYDSHVAQWDAYYQNSLSDIARYEVARRRALVVARLPQLVAAEQATIIEIGCGTGQVIAQVVETNPGWQGIGYDISQQMIHHCRRRYGARPNLSFYHHDVDSAAVDEVADAVLAMGVLGYLKRPSTALTHVYNMLRPGGYFLFTANKPSLPGTLTRAYRSVRRVWRYGQRDAAAQNKIFRQDELRALLAGRFQVVETRDYCYLPYVPLVRRLVYLSRGMEWILGRFNTPFSSTTLFVSRKREQQ